MVYNIRMMQYSQDRRQPRTPADFFFFLFVCLLKSRQEETRSSRRSVLCQRSSPHAWSGGGKGKSESQLVKHLRYVRDCPEASLAGRDKELTFPLLLFFCLALPGRDFCLLSRAVRSFVCMGKLCLPAGISRAKMYERVTYRLRDSSSSTKISLALARICTSKGVLTLASRGSSSATWVE